MRILFLITLYLIIFSNMAFAGEIYTWTDKKGVEHITTTPPPEYAKVKDRSTFKRDDPREIEAFQRKQKAAIDKGFAGWQNSHKHSTPSPTSTFDDTKRSEKIKNTEQLTKKFWDEVDRCRTSKCKVDKSLRDQYMKAVAEDPRTITTKTVTIRK